MPLRQIRKTPHEGAFCVSGGEGVRNAYVSQHPESSEKLIIINHLYELWCPGSFCMRSGNPVIYVGFYVGLLLRRVL